MGIGIHTVQVAAVVAAVVVAVKLK